MLINVSEGEECRIALMENGRLEEFYIERTSATSHVGNIYKGRVVNVEPSIQAAFIDFGLGRNGFLHISDLLPSYFGRKGEEITETVGRKLARRDRPPIQRCLRRGDEIIVQIIKEGIGTKGPTLTTYLSIPGRILVMMPGMSKMGVSRKIEDEVERRRLRQILDALEPPEECGFIIRTAGIGRSKADIQRDLAYLTRLWRQINKKIESGAGPMELYTEGDLVTRTVRDVFSTEIDAIIVDNAKVAEEVREFIQLTSPKAGNKVEYYDAPLPLFHKYNIEKEIEMMYSRHVPLPSGGSLVIDQTEAIVAIDVNSGKFRDHSDAETTAFKTDMEAAEEIPRQLKLRDLGGVIICDFIDLRYERHRRELEGRLHENFKSDRAKTKVLRMSQFGIIELTRQRMRPSVKRSIYCDCPHCRGSGLVKTPESMSLDVMRKLAIATHEQRVVRIELTVSSDVAFFLNNRKRRGLAQLEAQTGKRILVKVDPALALDEVKFELFDGRDGIVTMPELLPQVPQTIQEAQLMAKQSRPPERGGRGDRRDQRGRHDRPERRPHFEEEDEHFGREEFEEPEQHEPASPAEEPLVEEVAAHPHGEHAPEETPAGGGEETELEEIGEAPEPIDDAEEAGQPVEAAAGEGDASDLDEDMDADEIDAGEAEEPEAVESAESGEPAEGEMPAESNVVDVDEDMIDAPQELGEAPGEYIEDERRRYDRRDRRDRYDRRDDRGHRRDQYQGQRGQGQGGQQQRPQHGQPQRDQRHGAPQGGQPRQNAPQGGQRSGGDQPRPQGEYDQEGGRGRRRRRRGRGRGHGEQGFAHDQQRGFDRGDVGNVRTPRDEDRPRGLPSNIWIQMPGDEPQQQQRPQQPPQEQEQPRTQEPMAKPAQQPSQQRPAQPEVTPAPIAEAPIAPPPVRRVISQPVAPVQPPPAKPTPSPAPQAKPAEPVAPAPIAEWPETKPVIRKRPPILTPAPTPAAMEETPAEEEKPKKGRGKKGAAAAKKTTKKTAEKPAAEKPAKGKKAATSKSRSKKKATAEEPDIDSGPVEDEPKVRIAPIADENTVVKVKGDKHLATDEPVDPDAIRKVNTRRDLDHVPEEIE